MPFSHALSYVPGSSTGLIDDAVALLVDADPVGPVVASCRAALADRTGVDGVLGALAATGPPPSFALVATDGDTLRLVVGGRGQAEFAGGVAATVGAAGAPGWLDRRLDGAPDLRLSLADPGRPIDPSWPVLPIEVGTVLAVALIVPAPLAEPAPQPAAQPAPARVVAGPGPAPVDPDATTGQFPAEPPASPPTVVVPTLPAPAPPTPNLSAPAPAYVAPAPPGVGDAPMVQAVMCASGHLNAPFVVGACRVCGAPVPAQAPFLAPRPTLGVLVLDSGERVPVDRDVLLGRAPFDVDSVHSANPAGPRIVTLPSPDTDLSRTHVRVAIDGWLVQVTDLGSTNGTVATMPGQQGVRLRAHDPFVLVPGTVINLADEAFVRFELP